MVRGCVVWLRGVRAMLANKPAFNAPFPVKLVTHLKGNSTGLPSFLVLFWRARIKFDGAIHAACRMLALPRQHSWRLM